MDNIIELIMTIVGVVVALSNSLQLIHIWKRKSSDDVSVSMWVCIGAGYFCWASYAIYKGFYCNLPGFTPLLVMSIVVVIISSLICGFSLYYRRD